MAMVAVVMVGVFAKCTGADPVASAGARGCNDGAGASASAGGSLSVSTRV